MKPALAVLALLFLFSQCRNSPYSDGEAVFTRHCAGCHQPTGQGLGALIPPLSGSDFLKRDPKRLPCLVRYGTKDSLTVNGVLFTEPMAGIPTLTDVEITNVLNYVNHTWGNPEKVFQLEEVREILRKCGQ